ncbi:glycosyl transferase family 90 [Endomicrobium proavitum]|uniref:glycosyl transferase family 90 n=1 Tax=Endomicrobium proavitum TaxID=1408281 RepID=UPI00192CF34F|nr:glycosyl transferase family 90 [Endomicrobium proavitum]
MARLDKYDREYIFDRVNYYNKLGVAKIDGNMKPLSKFKYTGQRNSAYFFDSYEYTRYFQKNLKMAFSFGDVNWNVETPAITKSRPLDDGNINNVLLNLDKSHHFVFVKDKKKFEAKKNMLVGRCAVWQANRAIFYEKYFGHPMCDLGKVNVSDLHPEWLVKRMTYDEHMDYKFILCLEGNDVASNLKWVMSSNSIAVMPKPKYETWYMEGRLIANVHYIEIKQDYSDLQERLEYYMRNTSEAIKIVENAHQWVKQFKDKKREDLISVLVLEKYFKQTGQLS